MIKGHASRSQVKVKFSPKRVKNETTGHISDAISPTDLILLLGTKVQPCKVQSMTQVPMTLGQGQGQIFPTMGKIINNCISISNAISPVGFILGTKVQLVNSFEAVLFCHVNSISFEIVYNFNIKI